MIAQTILQQLGGVPFLLLTGTKNPMQIEKGVRMRLARNKNRYQFLEVTLQEDDTYTMRFFSWDTKNWKAVNEKIYPGCYCDMLSPIFEAETGLYTHF